MQHYQNQKPALPTQPTAKRKTCVQSAKKMYLRRGNLLKHINSGKCSTNIKRSNTLDELKKPLPVVQALGIADSARSLNVAT